MIRLERLQLAVNPNKALSPLSTSSSLSGDESECKNEGLKKREEARKSG